MKKGHKKGKMVLAEYDRGFVEDLSRKLVVRAYLVNSQRKPRTLLVKIRNFFFKPKAVKAPVVDIFKAIEARK